MAHELKEERVLLCEGLADERFFQKLIEQRGLPKFDVFHAEGKGKFPLLLRGIRGDPAGFSRVRGVLIVADSGDDPARSFASIRKQVKKAGSYSLPSAPSSLSIGRPRVSILLLPIGSPGSLESLCLRALVGRKQWLYQCLDEFLSCGQIGAMNWPPEKLAKARYCSAVAATYKRDPSQALSWAFKSRPKNPAMLSAKSPAFNGVARALLAFSNRV
jgi:hypothetical protein